MATVNIRELIICKHEKECRRYSVWVGDGKFSDCINCKNNEWKDPKKIKEDYYKPVIGKKIADIVLAIICVGIFFIIYGLLHEL